MALGSLRAPLWLAGAWICVLRFLWFVVLLRCGRLPFASQLGWLSPLQHGADIGQTHLHLSLLRHESLAVAGLASFL